MPTNRRASLCASRRLALPCLGAPLLSLRRLQREEAPGEAELYAQQPGEKGLGAFARGVALVELQVLLLKRYVPLEHG